MSAILFFAFLFWLAVHGFPWVTWVIAIMIGVGWVARAAARVRWYRWWVNGPPR